MSKSKSAKLARERFKSAARRVCSEEFIWDIDGSKTFSSRAKIFCASQLAAKQRENPLDGKEFVKIVTRDGVRNLLVPSKRPNTYEEFWPQKELVRLENKAKVLTVEDKMIKLQKRLEENKKLKEDCEKRKQRLREIDMAKRTLMENELDSYQIAENENKLKLLDRAYLAKQEQEEEVKQANRIILATKCSVIRDAQIAEKNEIEREFRNENLRLERMMLEERDKALIEEEQKREVERKNVLKYSMEIRAQLEEREAVRAKEVERIEEEAAAMKKALMAIEKEDVEKARIRSAKIQKTREGLQKSSHWSQYFKNLQFEKERIAELKVQEYMRQRLERDKQLELERRLAKEEREKEYDKILQRQQKLLESKTERNELEYRRQREEVEREFRRREKEAAIKKREMADDIAKARNVQLEEVKRQRAMQIARDEANFNEFMGKLRVEKDREELRKKLRSQTKCKYRDDIIAQIEQKKVKKREMEEKLKREKMALIDAERQREKNVKQVIETKVKDMKANNVPEKFIKDVERQLNNLANLTLSVKSK
ncbi:hypothetical protein ACKWTF_009451 [Chironomus riparius]